MLLTLDNQITGNIHTIEISLELTLNDLFAVIEAETGLEGGKFSIIHNGRYLDDAIRERILREHAFSEPTDLILLQMAKPKSKAATAMPSFVADMERKLTITKLKKTNPQLAEYLEQHPEEYERLKEAEEKRRRILADPNSLEAQQAIEEGIRHQNIMQNLEAALEANPESFSHIDMLYVRCQVDGHQIDAFVDTGAQMTIMTLQCAEKCGILRLLDHRYEGVAVGVGTGKISGRIHSVPVKLGNQFMPCAFTVLEDNSGPEVIIGLDTLRRLQAVIDMKRDALVVGEEVIPFLKGSEIPKEAFGSLNKREE